MLFILEVRVLFGCKPMVEKHLSVNRTGLERTLISLLNRKNC